MDMNNAFSTFQLKGVRIIKLNVANDFVDLPNLDELDISINMGNNKIVIEQHNDLLTAPLQLSVRIDANSKIEENHALKIGIIVEGYFTFKNNDEETFKQMLLLNGNSTLYSIARSHIITVSSLSLASGNIVLPMVNFVELLKNQENSDE